MSKTGNPNGDARVMVLATIILLLITNIINSGAQFYLLFSMVILWIDVINCGSVPFIH